MAAGTALGSGVRWSSTGVPTTTITCSAVLTTAESALATSRPEATTSSRAGWAPFSWKGILADWTSSTTRRLLSNKVTDRPAAAKAMPNGRPTWPHPPTITTSREKSMVLIRPGESATLVESGHADQGPAHTGMPGASVGPCGLWPAWSSSSSWAWWDTSTSSAVCSAACSSRSFLACRASKT